MSLNAENEVSFRIRNARGQRVTEIDRLGFATHWAYDAGGNLLSLTDAEAQTTSYTYNDAGQRITEQYPDHIAGAVIGDAGYGIITFSYDALGRRPIREPAERLAYVASPLRRQKHLATLSADSHVTDHQRQL